MATAELRDVQLSEVTFESLGAAEMQHGMCAHKCGYEYDEYVRILYIYIMCVSLVVCICVHVYMHMC